MLGVSKMRGEKDLGGVDNSNFMKKITRKTLLK